ncbi:MAG TPA: hypothetical protein VN915_14420 [Elusimicrobiota bacterium]|nr:hypothetical protein [Elusimicrobiota bacterium]
MAKKIPSVAKTAPKRGAKAPAAKKAALVVSIDYPREGESVRSGHYAIRLTASGATSAQIRFDGGEWADCREAVGHFWLDWSPAVGSPKIEARARSGKGRWAAAPAREVSVVDGWSTN